MFAVYFCLYCLGWVVCTFVWMKNTLEEVKAFTMKEDLLAPILFCIPLLNVWLIYTYSTALQETQAKIGMPEDQQINPIVVAVLMFLMGVGIILFQNSCNATWEFVRAKAGAPPTTPERA